MLLNRQTTAISPVIDSDTDLPPYMCHNLDGHGRWPIANVVVRRARLFVGFATTFRVENPLVLIFAITTHPILVSNLRRLGHGISKLLCRPRPALHESVGLLAVLVLAKINDVVRLISMNVNTDAAITHITSCVTG